jgi:O-antigen ligase
MIAPFKAFAIPLLIWLAMLYCVGYGMARKAEWSLYLFAVLAPLPSLWYPTHQFVLGKDSMDLLFLGATVGMWVQGKRSPSTQGRLIVASILYSYVSVWVVSSYFGFSVPLTLANPVLADWKNYAIMLAWFFLAQALISTEAQARVLMNIFVGVLLFMCWRELSGFVAGSSFSWSRRAEGPFWIVGLNSNHFGAFVAQTGLLALGLAGYETQRWRRWMLYTATVLSLYPLQYSYSRGAYVGFMAGLFVLCLLRYRKLLLVAVFVVVMWDTVLPESVVERISMTGGGEDGALEESAALRLVMWELARGLFSSNPILGIGYQGFIYASADQPLHNVHNYYLQTASEQGVIGIVLLAGTLLLGVFTGFKLWRKATTPFLKGMGLGTLGYSVCVVVVNVFGDRYSQLAMGSYFFLLLGASVRMLRLSQPLPVVPAPLPLRRLPALRLRRGPPAGPDVDADVVDVVPTGVHHA